MKTAVKKPGAAHLFHATKGTKHVVGVRALRVMLLPDGNGWYAQGLEIDYAASGKTVDEAKQNFGDGLSMTIREHLKMHGDLKKLLILAPQEAWDEFLLAPDGCIKASFNTLQAHNILKKIAAPQHTHKVKFPFDSIQFIEPELAAA